MAGSVTVGSAAAGAFAAESFAAESIVAGALVFASAGFTTGAAGSFKFESVGIGSTAFGSVDSAPVCALGLVSVDLFSVELPLGSEGDPEAGTPGPFPLILPGPKPRLGGRLDSVSAVDGEFELGDDSSEPVELLFSFSGRVTPGAIISHPLPFTVMEAAVP